MLSANHESPLQAHREALAAVLQTEDQNARLREAVRLLLDSSAALEMSLQKLLAPLEEVVSDLRTPRESGRPRKEKS